MTLSSMNLVVVPLLAVAVAVAVVVADLYRRSLRLVRFLIAAGSQKKEREKRGDKRSVW